jgi:hypothetical protein
MLCDETEMCIGETGCDGMVGDATKRHEDSGDWRLSQAEQSGNVAAARGGAQVWGLHIYTGVESGPDDNTRRIRRTLCRRKVR